MRVNKYHLSHKLLLTVGFTIGLILSSNVTLPFYPVPFTLQTLVLLVAVFYNLNIAFRSTLLYVVLGMVGAPVFAGWENGVVLFSHPYAGYVLGFVFATGLLLLLKPQYILTKICVFYAVLFTTGVIYLGTILGYRVAIEDGFVFYIVPEIIKTIVAYSIYRYIR